MSEVKTFEQYILVYSERVAKHRARGHRFNHQVLYNAATGKVHTVTATVKNLEECTAPRPKKLAEGVYLADLFVFQDRDGKAFVEKERFDKLSKKAQKRLEGTYLRLYQEPLVLFSPAPISSLQPKQPLKGSAPWLAPAFTKV